MEQLYDESDLETTEEIARMCNVQMAFQKSKLPVFENKLHIDSSDYLVKLCKKGIRKTIKR